MCTHVSKCKNDKIKFLKKKVVKVYLFAEDMVIYLKDLKNSTKKTLTHHKQLRQQSRIKRQFTKISSLSIYKNRE
jgi:hypothetical protein